MFYTIEDINNKIDEFFSDKPEFEEELINDIKYDIEDIWHDSIDDGYIDKACASIKGFIDMYTGTIDDKGKKSFKDKNKLPEWIRLLVWACIYNHISSENKKYRQTDLLKKMGLPADIFREKHWDMYSPDFKYCQEQYESIYLPFKHSEIEGNEIFRAMIHYMICHSTVPTDNFVDVFGKLGIIAGQCAKGYGSKQVWIPEKINVVQCFALALKKPTKVNKILKRIQHLIKYSDNKESLIRHIMGDVAGDILKIKVVADTDKILQEGIREANDVYIFAEEYIILLYFQPEYWLDTNYRSLKEVLEEEELAPVKGKEKEFSNELRINISSYEINKFLKLDFKDTLEKLSSIYKSKSFSFKDIDIREMFEYKNYDKIHEYVDRKSLLYVDVPKYIREERKSHIIKENYLFLFNILLYHSGDWILVWKNFVEITDTYKNGAYYKIYSEKKINPTVGDISYDVEDEESKEVKIEMLDLYAKLAEVSKKRQLYVWRCSGDYFHSKSNTQGNSIIFITTIDISKGCKNEEYLVDWKSFAKKYGINRKEGINIKLIAQKFEDFKKHIKIGMT